MKEESKYVFTDGIDTYAKTKQELKDYYGKEDDPVEVEEQNNDVVMAYKLQPLRHVEVIGRSEDQIYAVVDLSNQDKKQADKRVSGIGDTDLLKEDLALEAIDGAGYGQVHNLYSYNEETVEMLKALDDNQDVTWKAEKDLRFRPARGGDVKSLELPPAKVRDALAIEKEVEKKKEKADLLKERDLDGDGDIDETDQLIKNERMTPSRYEKRREVARRGLER